VRGCNGFQLCLLSVCFSSGNIAFIFRNPKPFKKYHSFDRLFVFLFMGRAEKCFNYDYVHCGELECGAFVS
jgi:hypothetical protein